MSSHVFIKGNNGKYVCGESANRPLICNTNNPSEGECFEMIQVGGGKVALKCMGRYVSSENGQQPMMCNRSKVDDWEKFLFIKHPQNLCSFRGNNGKYVSNENGIKGMMCNREHIKGWELFTLVGTNNQHATVISMGSAQSAVQLPKVLEHPSADGKVNLMDAKGNSVPYKKYVNMVKSYSTAIKDVGSSAKTLTEVFEKCKEFSKQMGKIAACAGIVGATIGAILTAFKTVSS